MEISKRRALLGAGALAGAGLAGVARGQTLLKPTRGMDLGPFYPVERPIEEDADLTRLKGHAQRAKGQVIELAGRVLDHDGQPVPHAKVEIWQANAVGRYRHHGDDHATLPLDENFQGGATQLTDAEGRYRFLTIKPGAYPSGGGRMRSPHIHFDVDGRWSKIISQMYFPHEALLAQDVVLLHDLGLARAPKGWPQDIFGKLTPGASTLEPGAPVWRFDVILRDG